ncbi:unnamed protein product [Moneuplotes crassus]|uniref:Rab-GAP TBC domain-containing protein n=1 Tax=Euplotes crassus TaxID=5936 RepID=A0AAD1X7A5_EUPCR|nr:unnamed protein product [Moneuplotes crassus]
MNTRTHIEGTDQTSKRIIQGHRRRCLKKRNNGDFIKQNKIQPVSRIRPTDRDVQFHPKYKEGVVTPDGVRRKKRRENDMNISQDSPPLDSKVVPTFTPNLRASNSTLYTSNVRGAMTSILYNGDQAAFTSPMDSNNSTALNGRRLGTRNKDRGYASVTNDSLNDRVDPSENYEENPYFKTPDAMRRLKRKHFGVPTNPKYMSLIPNKMRDIEEDIDVHEMNDSDNQKDRKVREYSFSPTKTPSKNGRDELNRRRHNNFLKNKINSSNYSVARSHFDREPSKLISTVNYSRLGKYRVVQNPKRYHISNFKMEDQPNYDGVDSKIILWCTCKADHKKYFCQTGRSWTEIVSHDFRYLKWKDAYENILIGQKQCKQISRDIERTFQKHYAFRHTSMVHRLSRVLNAISLYDPKLGYVQGMNFLVGAFLLHCEECITFWLVIELFESYEMREVYEDGLIGMYRHSAICENLIEEYLPEVWDHFKIVDIRVEMFMSDWAISFLCSYIPLSRLDEFFTYFFKYSWRSFHCMVLAILEYLKFEIVKSDDMPSCMNTIKMLKEHRNSFKFDRSSFRKKKPEMHGMKHCMDLPKLRFENKKKKDTLTLSFRKEMEEVEQQISHEKWDEVFDLFRKYLRKVTKEKYKEVYAKVQV